MIEWICIICYFIETNHASKIRTFDLCLLFACLRNKAAEYVSMDWPLEMLKIKLNSNIDIHRKVKDKYTVEHVAHRFSSLLILFSMETYFIVNFQFNLNSFRDSNSFHSDFLQITFYVYVFKICIAYEIDSQNEIISPTCTK